MRRGRDNGILKDDNGRVVAFNLGADYTSEHEWGIKGLRSKFGMSESGYGLDRRSATVVPPEVIFHEFSKTSGYLLVGVKLYKETPAEVKLQHYEIASWSSDEPKLYTAWDERSFGIHVTSLADLNALKELKAAIDRKDICLWIGGGGVFENGGLIVAIKSRIPAEGAEKLRNADIDREKLVKAGEATGIAERLKKAGKQYYALSPSWLLKSTKDGEVKTKHNVMFWLNPCDQRNVNYGWFTVEQLDQWIQGKGPIPMTEEQKRRA